MVTPVFGEGGFLWNCCLDITKIKTILFFKENEKIPQNEKKNTLQAKKKIKKNFLWLLKLSKKIGKIFFNFFD